MSLEQSAEKWPFSVAGEVVVRALRSPPWFQIHVSVSSSSSFYYAYFYVLCCFSIICIQCNIVVNSIWANVLSGSPSRCSLIVHYFLFNYLCYAYVTNKYCLLACTAVVTDGIVTASWRGYPSAHHNRSHLNDTTIDATYRFICRDDANTQWHLQRHLAERCWTYV